MLMRGSLALRIWRIISRRSDRGELREKRAFRPSITEFRLNMLICFSSTNTHLQNQEEN